MLLTACPSPCRLHARLACQLPGRAHSCSFVRIDAAMQVQQVSLPAAHDLHNTCQQRRLLHRPTAPPPPLSGVNPSINA